MKVKVKNSRGEVQWVPAHWIDHPILGAGFSRFSAGKTNKKPAGKKAGSSISKENK